MSLAPRLDLRQSQSLVMTPQLQQAIKLLALSNLEVEAFIAEELEKNPLLDAQGGGGEDAPEAPSPADQDEWDAPRDGPADASELLSSGGEAHGEAALDVDLAAETFHHDSASDSMGGLDGGLGLNGGVGGGSEDGPDFDNMAAGATSLADHLLAQVGTSVAGPDLFIAAQII